MSFPPAIPPPREVVYECNCTRICRSSKRRVPRTTYYRHRPFREEDEQNRQAAWCAAQNVSPAESEPKHKSKRHSSRDPESSQRPRTGNSDQPTLPPRTPSPIASTSSAFVLGDQNVHSVDDPDPVPDVPEPFSPALSDQGLHEPTGHLGST
ncbi:hypothetical protein CERSUDRAFT_74775 [Gelatoporia subvermispora B]|uniref:Uncharacterized protein n=1 Tax=Ceriporiopsis subvermispora (strain B) TaxID=914234 RepID=M2RB40_CERS8|nr:hypothetical protein CERSUDRAFT_74775 [Gelatoporia subvermispora B]